MLKKRLLTALWGIPLLVIAIWFATPIYWFSVLAAAAGVLAAVEFFRITGVVKALPLFIAGLLFTVLFIIYPHFHCNWNVPPLTILLMAAVVLTPISLLFMQSKEGLFQSWAWLLGGILYIGWLLGLLVALRIEPGTAAFPEAGRNFLFLALFTTFGSDTAAYFVGKAIGRHKMAPHISPGKTWEGAAAGLLGGVIITLLFIIDTPLQLPLSYWQAIVLGLLISFFGQCGDLVESLLKRNFGVKDSGTLMPGHGGLLDRLDSILFAGVVVYLYYFLVVI
jgi:phosphatidate cytidylyltransferase